MVGQQREAFPWDLLYVTKTSSDRAERELREERIHKVVSQLSCSDPKEAAGKQG